MTQALLLKTDAAISNNIAGEKRAKNQATGRDDTATDSFSSALDKQVDKQAVQSHKKTDKTSSVDQAAKPNEKHDKKSSDKLDETSENSEYIAKDPLADKTETPIKMTEEEAAAELSKDKTVTTELTSDDETVDGQITVQAFVGQEKVIKDQTNKTDNNKHLAENSKLASNVLLPNKVGDGRIDQEGEAAEEKQSLRSDLLNALSKKPNAQGENEASTVEQKKIINASLTAVNKEGLSEKQKMMALVNNARLKDSLLTGSGLERSSSVSSVLQTASSNSNSAVSTTAVAGQPVLNLQPPLQSEAWGRVLSSRVVWMAKEGVQQASLKLNPASMGLVEVKLHLHNEQASISFVAHHAATRDALEQALPRLRESFQENGMELAHADVSQENFSEADEQNNNKTTNNDSTSRRNKNDADVEITAHDMDITEQDIALGVSVFA